MGIRANASSHDSLRKRAREISEHATTRSKKPWDAVDFENYIETIVYDMQTAVH